MSTTKHKAVPRADWSPTAIYKSNPAGALSPAQAVARRKLILAAEHDARRFVVAFDVQHDHAPALRSVIEEMTAMIAARLGGKNTAAQETSLTAAAVALGALRASVLPNVPEGDVNYRSENE